jgi:Flp pilus assembly protein TadD
MNKPPVQQSFEQAVRLHSEGRLSEAEVLYRRILDSDPRDAVAFHHLGVIAHQTGRQQLAAELLSQAITLNPSYAEAHSNLGNILRQSGKADEAVAACRRAIELKPDYASAYNNLGLALTEKGDLDGALSALRKAIALNESFPDAYNNLGNALRAAGKLDEAAAAFRRAIGRRPNFAEAHNNLGTVLLDKGETENAIAEFRQAIAIRPNYPNAHSNLGIALAEKGEFEPAEHAAREAIRLSPDLAEAHGNLAMVLLVRGDFERGWEEYEWRWKCKSLPPVRNFAQPQWDGSVAENRTILLHTEQGFGDTIQFIRFVSLMTARGGKIIVPCQPELVRLFKISPLPCRVIARSDPLPAFDAHCPLLSLPRIFQTTLANVPGNVPYLQPDPQDFQKWRDRTSQFQSKLKVGLMWAGRTGPMRDRRRDTELAQWIGLQRISGATFFSLRKEEATDQSAGASSDFELIDWTRELKDFAETAALIANLDLVITVDSAVAHLAGAMGKPTWTLLPFAADWRWLQAREDSPWYPTMRLFRQHSNGAWDDVIKRISIELTALARE